MLAALVLTCGCTAQVTGGSTGDATTGTRASSASSSTGATSGSASSSSSSGGSSSSGSSASSTSSGSSVGSSSGSAGSSGASGSSSSAGSSSTGSHIYWGALEDGDDTYDDYYGPSGFWQDAPWGNTGNTMDRFDANAGKQVSILSYGQPPPWDQTTFYASTMDIVWNRGAIPLLTMSPGSKTLAEISSGVEDAAITTWADAVKTYGKPFFLRFAWEMNGDWYAWGQQPTAYIAAWRHFHDVVEGAGATNVTWVWCPNLDIGPYPLADYYPGDAYVDWLGLDGYNKGTSTQSFASLYQSSYDQLLAISDKPIVIVEIGSLEYGPGEKAAWITDTFQTQLPDAFTRIKAVVWFNWRILETDRGVTEHQPFPIESSAESQAAFHDAIASPYYLAGGAFPAPAVLSKIPPP